MSYKLDRPVLMLLSGLLRGPMKRTLNRFFVACAACAAAVILAGGTEAASTIAWQTTFNCNDWNQKMGLADSAVCAAGDGIAGHGAWTTAGHPNGDEIIAAANNPGGGGGKGFRHWRADGSNANGGGLRISLPSSYPEVWIRWYMRYQSGFRWSSLNYTKEVYLNAGSTGWAAVGFHGSGRFGTYVGNPGRYVDGQPGWSGTMGSVGDGLWHCYEIHVKTGQGNGISEQWIDGAALTPRYTDVNWGTLTAFSDFLLGSNQATPGNGTEAYTDYDDLAVSTTGPIGCAGLPPALRAPVAPTNLRIIR